MKGNILQILPRAPGTMDGVGDYALHLARGLRDHHGISSVFLAGETDSREEIDSFRIYRLREFSQARVSNETCNGIILHYVNYGFQKRGVPVTLLSFLRTLRRDCGSALLVIFHELFASGPPWRSEFWLRGLQKRIARDIAQLADAGVVSCESMRAQLERLSRGRSAIVQPVTSTWGEPALDETQLRERDPHCWLICGGTALLERSLRSFLNNITALPAEIAPHTLLVVGGANNPHVRALLNVPGRFASEYFPAVAPADAAPVLGQAGFAWMDYFSSPHVPADVLLKSSTFLGLCAHGVVPVLPRVVGDISIGGDRLPFPFAAGPSPAERADAAVAGYHWYHRHASAAHLSRVIAQQLQLT